MNDSSVLVSKKKIVRPTNKNVSKVAKKRVKTVAQSSSSAADVRKKRTVKKTLQEPEAEVTQAKKRTVKRRKVSSDD